jgi:hypothetical protein
MDFEAWPKETMDEAGGDSGRKTSEANRIAVMFAVGVLCKTKPELITMIRDMGEELTLSLLKQFAASQDSLRAGLEMLDGHHARPACSPAALCGVRRSVAVA